MEHSTAKPVGLTQSAGWQIGFRKTLPIERQKAWEMLLSPEGLKQWLGQAETLDLTVGQTYATGEGTTGQIRVVRTEEQIRMTWQPAGWDKPSTLQIRLLPAQSGRTTVSFHQENLANGLVREEMKERWERAAAWLEGAL